jgi:carbon-monoxide dehydrogenase medium subunit
MLNPASRYAIVGAGAVIALAGGRCTAADVAVGGLTPSATKTPSVGAALVGKRLDDATIDAAASAVQDDLGDDLISDIHASADYRRAMATVYVSRALRKAVARAAG